MLKVSCFASPHNGVHASNVSHVVTNLHIIIITINLCTSQDPWLDIHCFIEDFDLARKRNCIPGCHRVVDECMSEWNGAHHEYVAEGMPHKTKVARKPEWMGAEMKSLAYGEKGIF